jgi:hypothetical protein
VFETPALGVTRRPRPSLGSVRRARGLTTRRDFSVDGCRLCIHSEQLLRRGPCGDPVYGQIRGFQPLPLCQTRTSTMVLPHGAEGRRTMNEQPRPRASSWQIAGVWISAVALLIAAARAAVDLWLVFR